MDPEYDVKRVHCVLGWLFTDNRWKSLFYYLLGFSFYSVIYKHIMRNYSMSSSVLCAKHVRLIQLIRDLLIWTIFFKAASLMLTNHLSISVTYHVTHLINPQDSALLHHLGTQSLSVSRLPFLCVLPSVSGLGERERHALTKFLWGFLRSGMDYICLFSFKADSIKQIITRKKVAPGCQRALETVTWSCVQRLVLTSPLFQKGES